MQFYMQNTGYASGKSAAYECDETTEPWIDTLYNENARHNCAQRDCSIDRKVWKVQNAISDVNAKRQNGIHKAFLQRDLYNIE